MTPYDAARDTNGFGTARSLRILVVAPQPFFVQRGTPIAVRALLEALTRQGHHCDVLAFAEGDDPGLRGVRVFRAPAVPGTRGMGPGFSAAKLACDAAMVPLLIRLVRRNGYHLTIGVEEAAYLLRVLRPVLRVPYLSDIDSSIPEQLDDKYGLPRLLRRLLDGIEGAVVRGSLGAITCCRALEGIVAAHAPTLPVQTLEDVTLIGATSDTAPEDCRFAEPVAMYIGNLERYQGVDLLIEGFARASASTGDTVAPAMRLVIIGGTPQHVARCRDLARRMGVGERVSLLGPRPVERIGDYLAQATVVCSPRTEGRNTPMKVYSYLDSGRPLLATRLPTHTQILDEEIAMLVAPDADGIADGLRRLMADPSLRRRLANAASARVAAEFSVEAYDRKLASFMQGVILPRLPAAGTP